MFDWRVAVMVAYMAAGLLIVGNIAYRFFKGKSLYEYALIVPCYWAGFAALIKFL